jgi:hypothetical protein
MSSYRDADDNYYGLVAVLNDHWRVVDSKRAYPYRQWILQRRWGEIWHGRSYCQTKAVLMRDIRRRVGDIGEEAQRALACLPDRDLGIQARVE